LKGAGPTPAALDLPETWSRVREQLRAAVPDSTFQTWLGRLDVSALEGDTLVVTAPAAARGWIADRYGRVLQTSAAAVLGPDVQVELVTDRPRPGVATPPAPVPGDRPQVAFRDFELNPRYTFSQFVIGPGNRLAHAAALAVAELPAQAYNPLFIYGAPGLGKTHLLQAVAAYLQTYSPGLSVRCTTIEDFTSDFVGALRSDAIGAFKARYRRVDVLLIDDVQFLERRTRTEEEFFHTFNALHDSGAQLVLTSDRPPTALTDLEDRLRERLQSGLVTDVQAPDFDTRLAILRKRAAHDRLAVEDPGALDLIAARVSDNVRTLEGALIRIVAYHSLRQRPLSGASVADVLEQLYPETRCSHRPSLREIQLTTSASFELSVDELLSRSRSSRVSWPRQVAMFLARELTDETLPSIGRQFGGRDHTTVLHACQRITERIASDPDAHAQLTRLRTQLTTAEGDRVR